MSGNRSHLRISSFLNLKSWLVFSYASSTLHPCELVRRWAEFRTSIASRLADLFLDLIDVEETNSIPNDEAKRAIGCVSGNVQIFFAFP